jgi:hypothetical protein
VTRLFRALRAVVAVIVLLAVSPVVVFCGAWTVGWVGGWLSKAKAGSAGVKVYPVLDCPTKPCPDVLPNAKGVLVQRSRVALDAITFRAFPESQEVVRTAGRFGPESLTRDQHFTCTVLTPLTWACRHDVDGTIGEIYRMNDGHLVHRETPARSETLLYLPWCAWAQIARHNQTTEQDEPRDPHPAPHSELRRYIAHVVWLATGCLLDASEVWTRG